MPYKASSLTLVGEPGFQNSAVGAWPKNDDHRDVILHKGFLVPKCPEKCAQYGSV